MTLVAPSSGLRLVLDTKTALSALLWGGQPGRLIDAASQARIVLASDLALSTALAAAADLIVSGDAHLLDLKWFQGIPIVGTADALARMR